MGGIVCNIHAQAILRYQSVPANPQQAQEFDAQMRQLFNWVAQDVVNDAPDSAMTACAILAKPSFTDADRAYLLGIIHALYKPYVT